jgi:hypothetical protein
MVMVLVPDRIAGIAGNILSYLCYRGGEGRDRTACSSTERHEAPPSSQPTTGGDWTLLLHEGKTFEDAHAKDGSLPDPASTDNAEFKCVLLTTITVPLTTITVPLTTITVGHTM